MLCEARTGRPILSFIASYLLSPALVVIFSLFVEYNYFESKKPARPVEPFALRLKPSEQAIVNQINAKAQTGPVDYDFLKAGDEEIARRQARPVDHDFLKAGDEAINANG